MKPAGQVFGALLIAVLTLLSACTSGTNNISTQSSSGGPSGGSAATGISPEQFYTPPGAVLQATYTANTVRIDFPTVKRTLKAVSPDGSALVFDASDSRLQNLKAGNVLLLEHLGARQVVDIVQEGSQVGLITDDASLPEFIQDGHIQFTVPANFPGDQAEVRPPGDPGDLVRNFGALLFQPTLLYAETSKTGSYGLHAKGTVDKWEFEASGTRKGDGLALSLSATKDLGGLKAKVTAEGKVDHVSTSFNADVQGGKMQNFQYNTPMKGSLHITWAAQSAGQNLGIGESRLKLPPLAKQVIDVYGLPFLFQVNVNLIFKPGFGTPHDAASGGFDLDYDGAGGLIVHGGQSSTEGSLQASPSLQKTTSESLAAHGIVLAVNAPKLSMSFGTDSFKEALNQLLPQTITSWSWFQRVQQQLFSKKLSKQKGPGDFFKINGGAYVQLVSEFDYTASGPMSLVPCTITHFNMYAQAGADAQVLAMKGSSPTVEWFKSSKTWRNPDSDICGPKS
jgi:hypothetical protein